MEEIERRAEAVLAELPDYVWRGEIPPVPVEEIADTHFGLRVREVAPEQMRTAPGGPELAEGETISGLLISSLGEIWVNAEEAGQWPGRRRFTIGHELGHHVLHRSGQQTLFCRRATVDPDPASAAAARAGAPGHRGGSERLRRRPADAGRDASRRVRPRSSLRVAL